MKWTRGYCAKCPKTSYCDNPLLCEPYREYLSIISECRKGHPTGTDPCFQCVDKGDFRCPMFGPEADNFEQMEQDLPEEIGGIVE